MAHASGSHHIVPAEIFYKVFAALIVLTVLTVAVSRVDLGAFNTVVALAVATVKAALVLGFFMHLKYDAMMNRVIFASGFFFLFLLYILVALDDFTRVIQRSTL